MSTPLPPRNIFVLSPYRLGSFDIRWDAPGLQSQNAGFTIQGVDVYRSSNSIDGPYVKLNTLPVSVPYFQDDTRLDLITEDVSNAFTSEGNDSLKTWEFKTSNKIMGTSLFGPKPTNNPFSVTVLVNGQPATVVAVEGDLKKVRLQSAPYIDPITQKRVQPILPTTGDVVTATYYKLGNDSRTPVSRRTYYKLVTVANEGTTPLSEATPIHYQQLDGNDYRFEEALRRNYWILEQGGKEVKLFIKKWVGTPCSCYSETRKQASGLCTICYGVGIVGGYEGPFSILITPDNALWSLRHTPGGLTNTKVNPSWTICGHLLSPHDFLVYPNGERYVIGPITNVEHRGVPLQQFFDVSLIDQNDIRYQISIDPRPIITVTDHPLIPDGRENRGTTTVFENIEY